MFKRRRRHPTPGFGIPPPFNPIQGENANLRQDGTSPHCAMMQVAATDTYANYVICRGFDTRILRFIDYAAGDANKPGVSVAKPFGKRKTGTYKIGEIYPALLPTQGNADFIDFKLVTYTPPSPVAVNWRVGQNPGVVTGGLDGGQPANLSETIGILYDHNGKVVNWIIIDTVGNLLRSMSGVATAVGTQAGGDFNGLKYADVTVIEASDKALLGTSVRVYDRKGCIFDIAVNGYCIWAHELLAVSMDLAKACTETVKYWSADDRCCASGTAIYRSC